MHVQYSKHMQYLRLILFSYILVHSVCFVELCVMLCAEIWVKEYPKDRDKGEGMCRFKHVSLYV
jgi:hypothetical protein